VLTYICEFIIHFIRALRDAFSKKEGLGLGYIIAERTQIMWDMGLFGNNQSSSTRQRITKGIINMAASGKTTTVF